MNASETTDTPATEDEIAALGREAATLYKAARAREGAPWELLDRRAAACATRQGACQRAGDLAGMRAELLDAIEVFGKWVTMPAAGMSGAAFQAHAVSAAAAEPVELQAKNLVEALRSAGVAVRLTDDGKAVRIDGADRLTAGDRERLETLSRAVVAHLSDRGETLVVRVKA